MLVTDGSTGPAATASAELYDAGVATPADQDGDAIAHAEDNCPAVANADQADPDHDGAGTARGAVELPTTTADCKGGGWKAFHDGRRASRTRAPA